MDEALARFQREKQVLAMASKEEQSFKEGIQNYQAFAVFDKMDKSTRLQFRSTQGLTHSVSYNCLLDVCYDGFHGTELTLLYNFMKINIKGKNLQTMISAIERHECSYLQDFDAKCFHPPKANEVLVEMIEIVKSVN